MVINWIIVNFLIINIPFWKYFFVEIIFLVSYKLYTFTLSKLN
jgi:hypothetical protein